MKGITTSAVTSTTDTMSNACLNKIAEKEEEENASVQQPTFQDSHEQSSGLIGSPSKPTLQKSEAVDLDDVASTHFLHHLKPML